MLREAFAGRRRFAELEAALGVPKAVLAARLERLVGEGVLVRVRYQEHPPRDEYRLTEKGRALYDVLAAMWRWGSDWQFEDGPPVELRDRETGEVVVPAVVDERTGRRIDVRRLRLVARQARVQPEPEV